MEKKFRIYLDTITYGGENIGNDLTFTITPNGGTATTLKQNLSNGKSTAALNKTIFKADTKADSQKVKVEVSIVEKEMISDPGSGNIQITINLKKDGPQPASLEVEVKGVGGDKGKTGKFKLNFVAEVIKPITVKGKVLVRANSVATGDAGVNDRGEAPKAATVARELKHCKDYDGENVFQALYEITTFDGELDLKKSKVVLDTVSYTSSGKVVAAKFTTPALNITKVKLVGGDPNKIESFEFSSKDWYDPNGTGNNKLKDRTITGSLNLVKGDTSYVANYTGKSTGVIITYTLKGKVQPAMPFPPEIPGEVGDPMVFSPLE